MPTVESWFGHWTARHMERHPIGWPRFKGSPEDGAAPSFWAGLMGNFILHGLTEDVADEASARLMTDDRAPWREKHTAALVEIARAIFRERAEAAKGTAAAGSLEAYRAASRDCEDCQGNGFATRWRRLSLHAEDAEGQPIRRPPSITLYCRCQLGRFLERDHSASAPELRRRLHDLADHPWLWGEEYRTPPRPRVPPAAIPGPRRGRMPGLAGPAPDVAAVAPRSHSPAPGEPGDRAF